MITHANGEVQLLLSVGKKANYFFSYTEYVEELQQNQVTLLWGGVPFFSYLENDQKEVRNSLALGLVNAGMRQSDVCTVLRINPRQLQRYLHGDTSLSKNPGRPAVVTEEIHGFVKDEYSRICAEGPHRWRKKVADAVAEKFHIALKPSTLSFLVADLSQAASAGRGQTEQESTESSADAEGKGSAEETTAVVNQAELHDSDDRTVTVPFLQPEDPTELAEVQRQPGPIGSGKSNDDFDQEDLQRRLRDGMYSRYAGGLLLNPFICRILEGLVSRERAVYSATQFSFESYLLTFLQMNTFECNNYESIEQLHPDEFGPLVGVNRSPSLNTLCRITSEFLQHVEPVEFNRVIADNYLNNLAVGCLLFYVDGHFQRYFGKKKMLRDYHAQSHQVQKGYSQYALSTQDGSPFLLLDSDSMVNFKDSIGVLVERLLEIMPVGVIPRIVFDRGGYDRTLMARFQGDEAKKKGAFGAHYISWDQFDETDYRTYNLEWQDMVLQLKGNDPAHPRSLDLKVAEAPPDVCQGIWAEKSPAKDHRKLILRQDYHRHGRECVLCTPFCTSDHDAAAPDLVAELCLRWRQENVFKISDEDYGFDYISTYRTNTYVPEIVTDFPPSLQELLELRTMENPERRQAKAECQKLEKILGRISNRIERLNRGEKLRKDQSKLKLPNDEQALRKLYDEKFGELHQIEQERLAITDKVNRLEYLCENGYRRLDFSKKWILDILRATSHNVRRMALNTWMGTYTDWRDYTQRFRDLLRVGGYLRLNGKVLYVELKPLQQHRYQLAAEAFVKKIQQLSPTTFGIGPYSIHFSFKDRTFS